jgi:DNA-directed RNA polymerase specialized sigma24 family protein
VGRESWEESAKGTDPGTDIRLDPGVRAAVARGDERVISLLFWQLRATLVPLAEARAPAGHEAEELITTFLDDFLVNLPTLAIEASQLKRYAIASFRNHLKMVRRSDDARDNAYSRAATRIGKSSAIVAECHSEYSLASSDEIEVAAPETSSVRKGLASCLLAGLSNDEKLLLQSVTKAIPLRKTAEWLGIEYSACRVKLHRLRWRLQREALSFAETASPKDREALQILLERWGITQKDRPNGSLDTD